MPRNERGLKARDAKRDIGAELLESVRQMKAGKLARVTQIKLTPAAAARLKAGLSQSQFAASIGVSVRTLQDWEQGRREPSGAARTLLRIAVKHPKIVREAMV